MMAVSRQRHGVGYKNSRRMRILSQGDHQMRHTAIAACLTNLLLTVPVAARDTLMSAAELASFCSTGNSACEFYLQGAWDGIELASKNSGTPLVCAPQEPNAFNSKTTSPRPCLPVRLQAKTIAPTRRSTWSIPHSRTQCLANSEGQNGPWPLIRSTSMQGQADAQKGLCQRERPFGLEPCKHHRIGTAPSKLRTKRLRSDERAMSIGQRPERLLAGQHCS